MLSFALVAPLIETAPSVAPCTEATDDFSCECVEFFGEVVQLFGVAPSVGQIYGLLYASKEPLSFSDIFERLDISKGGQPGLNSPRSLRARLCGMPVNANGRPDYFYPDLAASLREGF